MWTVWPRTAKFRMGSRVWGEVTSERHWCHWHDHSNDHNKLNIIKPVWDWRGACGYWLICCARLGAHKQSANNRPTVSGARCKSRTCLHSIIEELLYLNVFYVNFYVYLFINYLISELLQWASKECKEKEGRYLEMFTDKALDRGIVVCESSGHFTHIHKHTTSNTRSESVFDCINTQAFCVTDWTCEDKEHWSLLMLIYLYIGQAVSADFFECYCLQKPKTRVRNDFIKS